MLSKFISPSVAFMTNLSDQSLLYVIYLSVTKTKFGFVKRQTLQPRGLDIGPSLNAAGVVDIDAE